jgi:hypothetical protein
MNIIIPMAGLGDRFKQAGFNTIKPMISIMGKPMIQWAIESLGIDGNFIFILNNKNEYFNELRDLLIKISPKSIIIDIDSSDDELSIDNSTSNNNNSEEDSLIYQRILFSVARIPFLEETTNEVFYFHKKIKFIK